MGAMYIGQQFLQNVLGYDTFNSGLAILPAALCMVLVAPRSAKLVEKQGARLTMLMGYVFVLLGFLTMLLLWKEDIPYWIVALGYAFVGIGVGFAGTPASHSLTGSVPVTRVGMASGTADLQRDLGGALMQSIFGALLAAGYAAAATAAIQASGYTAEINATIETQLVKSFAGAEEIAAQYPQYAAGITAGAKASFLAGDQSAYIAYRCCPVGHGIVVFLLSQAGGRRGDAGQFQREARCPSGLVVNSARVRWAQCRRVRPGQTRGSVLPILRARQSPPAAAVWSSRPAPASSIVEHDLPWPRNASARGHD
jgi:hypothetical protein